MVNNVYDLVTRTMEQEFPGRVAFRWVEDATGTVKEKTYAEYAQDIRRAAAWFARNIPEVEGKRVVLIDDSIVRGTTCRRTIDLLRKAGAKEIHMRVSAPPFVAACYYGTDIDDPSKLIANNHSVEEIAKIIGVDSLGYLSLQDVVKLADNTQCGFCTACFTGKYAVKPEEVLSTDIHERHLNDRPKDEKKLGE